MAWIILTKIVSIILIFSELSSFTAIGIGLHSQRNGRLQGFFMTRYSDLQSLPREDPERREKRSFAPDQDILCTAQQNQSFQEILANNSYTKKFYNDTSVNISVYWTGDDDKNILVATISLNSKPSFLYRSRDSGKTFQNITDQLNNLAVVNIHHNINNRKQVILVVRNFQIPSNTDLFLITKDGGLAFTLDVTSFRLLGDILFHPDNPQLLLAIGEKEKKRQLWLSTDAGSTWKSVHDNVIDVQWGSTAVDNNKTFYLLSEPAHVSPHIEKKEYDLKKTVNLGQNFTVISVHVQSFDLKGRFLYASVRADKQGKKSILRVSTTGGLHWNEAQLPTMVEDQFYRVLEMSDGIVFIHVDQPGDTGSGILYTSDTDGIIFSESLKKHLFPNEENVNDFYKVNSVRGVYLTSQLNKDHSIRTMVTFNRGATWHPVRKPTRSQCPSSACYLQMSYQFSARKGVKVPMGPLSSESAVGLVLTHGHVGLTLKVDPPDVFVSSDGGYNWTKALTGPHLYAIADHGGLLVAVPVNVSSYIANIVKFSTDEGQTWCSYKFTDDLIHVTGLLTDPASWSLKVGIWGYGVNNSEWQVTVIDFEPILKRKCKEPEDFEDFMAHNELAAGDPLRQGCLLGVRETYRKLKRNAWCYLGQTHQTQKTKDHCNCTKDDYECDFGYYRPADSDQCVENPVFKGAELDICLDGEERVIITTGYRKIPGDFCENGFNPVEHYSKDIKQKCLEGDKTLLGNVFRTRPNSTITNVILAAVVITVLLLVIFMSIFFVKKCRQINNSDFVYRYSRLSQEELSGERTNIDEVAQSLGLDVDGSSSEDEQMQPATLLVDTSDTMNVEVKSKSSLKGIDGYKKYYDDSDDELLQ